MSTSVLKAGSFVEWSPARASASGGSGVRRSRLSELEAELAELRLTSEERLAEEVVRLRDESRREALENYGHATRAMRGAAEALSRAAAEGIRGAEAQIVDLAIAVAEKIVRREIARDDAFTIELVKRCLDRIVRRSEVRVRVNPADHARVLGEREVIVRESGVGHEITVVADRRVGRGGCIVETPDFVVDGTIESQLAGAEEALRGEQG